MKKDAYDFVAINARCDTLAKRTNDDCRYILFRNILLSSGLYKISSENRIFLLQGLQLLSVVLFLNLSHKAKPTSIYSNMTCGTFSKKKLETANICASREPHKAEKVLFTFFSQ